MNTDVEPDPDDLFDYVYARPHPAAGGAARRAHDELRRTSSSRAERRPADDHHRRSCTMTLRRQALNRALRDALAEDPSVLVFGEDVGPLGGVFRITDGLTAEFGEDRCFDTPLAESGIVGMAVGLAMNGMRPVIEMQFDAFAYPAFEQVVSHIAKMRNRTRGRVELPHGHPGPVRRRHRRGRAPLRLVGGLLRPHARPARRRAGEPPRTPTALLREAIASPDPVVFLEPKKLYWAKERGRPGSRDGARHRHGGRCAARAPTRRSSPTARPCRSRSRPPRWPRRRAAACRSSTCARSCRSTTPPSARPSESTGRAVVVAEAAGFASVVLRDRRPG